MKKPRVLIFLMKNQIGDTVVSLPAIRAVRRHFGPEAKIWLMQRRNRNFLTTPAEIVRDSGEVDGIVVCPDGPRVAVILALLLRLWRLRFDWAVYADDSGVSERALKRDRIFLRFGGIAAHVGFHACTPQSRRADARGHPHMLKHEALCRLENLARDGVDISRESDFSSPFLSLSDSIRHPSREWLHARRNRPERPLVAVCPGAGERANQWPHERFVEIGRRLIDLDLYELVICGGPAERTAGDRMIAEWGQGINAAGAFSVLGSAAVLNECHFAVGLDTGTTHLAAATGTPCVTLQGGRVHPGHWNPLGSGHIIVRYPVPCGGCGLGTCVLSRHPCMRGITVEMAWRAILQMQRRLSPDDPATRPGENEGSR